MRENNYNGSVLVVGGVEDGPDALGVIATLFDANYVVDTFMHGLDDPDLMYRIDDLHAKILENDAVYLLGDWGLHAEGLAEALNDDNITTRIMTTPDDLYRFIVIRRMQTRNSQDDTTITH